jgi:hypothetical protein
MSVSASYSIAANPRDGFRIAPDQTEAHFVSLRGGSFVGSALLAASCYRGRHNFDKVADSLGLRPSRPIE